MFIGTAGTRRVSLLASCPRRPAQVTQQRRRCAVKVRSQRLADASLARASSTSGAAPFPLACPICLQADCVEEARRSLRCTRCLRSFPATGEYLDLLPDSGRQPRTYKERAVTSQSLFQSPLVSFAYERGWRQSFAWAGFPGADAEFDLAMTYLQPAYDQVLVDVSCGTGLFSRRFLRSGCFQGVLASDYSESMLQQAAQGLRELASSDSEWCCVRADVARLPLATASVAGVHAGAALHCWPSPSAAVNEISRVLQPGGVFVASTFLKLSAPLGEFVGGADRVRFLNQLDPLSSNRNTGVYRWFEEEELRELAAAAGLVQFRCTVRFRFIMISAAKPRS